MAKVLKFDGARIEIDVHESGRAWLQLFEEYGGGSDALVLLDKPQMEELIQALQDCMKEKE